MTDEELIARLRGDMPEMRPNRCLGWREDIDLVAVEAERKEAADRIEALLREAKGAEKEIANLGENLDATFARAKRLEALLREARTDLEHYVTHEYPKHLHPYYERQWNRDMELCRRIDAALKGADHE